MAGPAFRDAAVIEGSLERLAELGDDPTPLVYARLFARHPQMEPYFWRDVDGAIKGEMLSRAFEAILDFVGERRYADHMIGTEMITHEGYDVPRDIFITFFETIRDTVRDVLADEWTPAQEQAWSDLLGEIAGHGAATPRSDVDNSFFRQQREAFEAPYLAEA